MADIFLVRHAIAEPAGGPKPDPARELTPEGRERFAAVVRGLARMGVRFDRVYTSPWTRALQTAEMLRPLADTALVVTERLADTPSPSLLEVAEGGCVALVGHEPWMTELCSMLCSGGSPLPLVFKKGGVVWLRGEMQVGGAELRALLPPRVFRSLD